MQDINQNHSKEKTIPVNKWENNIQMNLKINMLWGCGDADWTHPIQETDKLQTITFISRLNALDYAKLRSQNLRCIKIFKRHKIKDHSDMFRIVCDPSSGSIELYLTEIRGGSLMFLVCLVGVWQPKFWTSDVCVWYDGLRTTE